MARKSNTRAAAGAGSIRQRPDGRWEARYSYEDELGVKKRSSVYAETEKECRRKLTAILKSVDDGTYRKTQRYTLSQWLDTWLSEYCTDLKPATRASYKNRIECRIKPVIGDRQLSSLTNVQLQRFINQVSDGDKGHKPAAPKSVQNLHGILHSALKQAVRSGIIASNPADYLKLPKIKKAQLSPLMDEDIARFLEAIKGDRFERLFIVALFTGMRQSELIGLRWDDVDLEGMTVQVRHQIQKAHDKAEYIFLDETKNGKERTATLTPSVVRVLKAQRAQQAEWKLAAGSAWNNEHGLVFTDEIGGHLKHKTVENHFKKAAKAIGKESTRFHDLRHSYAVAALQAGDSVKNVQEQLGHYSSAFTMDTYADVSETMRQDSRNKMEALIRSVSDL